MHGIAMIDQPAAASNVGGSSGSYSAAVAQHQQIRSNSTYGQQQQQQLYSHNHHQQPHQRLIQSNSAHYGSHQHRRSQPQHHHIGGHLPQHHLPGADLGYESTFIHPAYRDSSNSITTTNTERRGNNSWQQTHNQHQQQPSYVHHNHHHHQQQQQQHPMDYPVNSSGNANYSSSSYDSSSSTSWSNNPSSSKHCYHQDYSSFQTSYQHHSSPSPASTTATESSRRTGSSSSPPRQFELPPTPNSVYNGGQTAAGYNSYSDYNHIPSEHFPPTPYSADDILHSPSSSSTSETSSHQNQPPPQQQHQSTSDYSKHAKHDDDESDEAVAVEAAIAAVDISLSEQQQQQQQCHFDQFSDNQLICGSEEEKTLSPEFSHVEDQGEFYADSLSPELNKAVVVVVPGEEESSGGSGSNNGDFLESAAAASAPLYRRLAEEIPTISPAREQRQQLSQQPSTFRKRNLEDCREEDVLIAKKVRRPRQRSRPRRCCRGEDDDDKVNPSYDSRLLNETIKSALDDMNRVLGDTSPGYPYASRCEKKEKTEKERQENQSAAAASKMICLQFGGGKKIQNQQEEVFLRGENENESDDRKNIEDEEDEDGDDSSSSNVVDLGGQNLELRLEDLEEQLTEEIQALLRAKLAAAVRREKSVQLSLRVQIDLKSTLDREDGTSGERSHHHQSQTSKRSLFFEVTSTHFEGEEEEEKGSRSKSNSLSQSSNPNEEAEMKAKKCPKKGDKANEGDRASPVDKTIISPQPPCLLPQRGEVAGGGRRQRRQNADHVSSRYFFRCSFCRTEFPFNSSNVDEISRHVAKKQNPRSPVSSVFTPTMKLIVDPKEKIVTARNAFRCKLCPKEIEYSVPDLIAHSASEHGDKNNFHCLLCDETFDCLSALTDHATRTDACHLRRLEALAACGCAKAEREQSKTTIICTKCCRKPARNPASPWCSSCEDSVLSSEAVLKRQKRRVVLCSMCRQGKYGFRVDDGEKSSICANCLQLLKSRKNGKKRNDEEIEECCKYVRGMLNELLREMSKSSPRKQIAVVTPEPRFAAAADKFIPSTNISSQHHPQLRSMFPDAAEARFLTAEDKQLFDRRYAIAALECRKCSRVWEAIDKQNMDSFVRHYDQHELFESPALEERKVLLVDAKKNVAAVAAVLQCKRCRALLGTSPDQSMIEHVRNCSEKRIIAKANNQNDDDICPLCGKKNHHHHNHNKKRRNSDDFFSSSCLKSISDDMKALRKEEKCEICRNEGRKLHGFPAAYICEACLSSIERRNSTAAGKYLCNRECVACGDSPTTVDLVNVSFCRRCWRDLKMRSQATAGDKNDRNAKIIGALVKTFIA